MDTLGKLFGSPQRVKMLRLFLFAPETPFDRDDIQSRTKISDSALAYEIRTLLAIRFLKRKVFHKSVTVKRAGKSAIVQKKVNGFLLDERFPFRRELRQFMLATVSLNDQDIARRLSKAGRIALVIVAGSFLDPDTDATIDLLVVGDRINRPVLEAAIKNIEIEIGRDIRYAFLSISDFAYRRSIHDRLIRNVFDYPHRAVLDRLSLL